MTKNVKKTLAARALSEKYRLVKRESKTSYGDLTTAEANRRDFLRLSLVAPAAAVVAPQLVCFASDQQEEAKQDTGTQTGVKENRVISLLVRPGVPEVHISHPLLLEGVLHLWSVEGILDDSTQKVVLWSDLKPSWQTDRHSVRYSYAWGQDNALEARVEAREDVVDLFLRFRNGQERELHNANVNPCLQFKDASAFCDREGERTFLFGKSGVMRVRDTRRYTYPGWWRNVQCYALSGAEIQTRDGFIVPYNGGMDGRWGVSPDRVALGLIAQQRSDENAVVGFSFQNARYVSRNYNNDHQCIHSVPYFGNLGKGEASQVVGRIWFVEGKLDDLVSAHSQWVHEKLL